MEITGTVTSVRQMRTDHGSLFLRVAVQTRPGRLSIPLTYLHGSEPVPAKGQRVTVTGMPMIMRPRRGYRTNIGGVAVTIHEQETT